MALPDSYTLYCWYDNEWCFIANRRSIAEIENHRLNLFLSLKTLPPFAITSRTKLSDWRLTLECYRDASPDLLNRLPK